MKIVIMAGGKGTRIRSVNSDIPKPMISIFNKPVLEYQIDVLREQGFKDIIIVIGHLGYIIKDYFGDGTKISKITGKEFGVNIKYIEEREPLGTCGALYQLKSELTEDFLLLNGDIIFNVNIGKFYNFHKNKGGLATLFTHPNDHPYDSAILVADKYKRVIDWLHKEDKRNWYKNRVNAGLHMISPKILEMFREMKKVDLDREILKPLIPSGEIFVYDSPEYVKDMGTPDRLYSISEDFLSKKIELRNLSCKQKAIFMDRDGTINKYVGFLKRIEDFELIDGVADAIKKINESGYLAIVITNQPVIARGDLSVNELHEIHNKMETLLGEKGSFVDDILYCPHHPDKGFDNERIEYKVNCECRKPKPGLLMEAAKKYNIDLSQSWMIGDSESDLEAGINAGCKSLLIGGQERYGASYSTLAESIDYIIGKK